MIATFVDTFIINIIGGHMQLIPSNIYLFTKSTRPK